MKLLNSLLPLIDHLYIFQLLEYHPLDFLKWFFRYPFKRDLQRKQHVQFTLKIKVLFILSLLMILSLSLILCAGFASFFLILFMLMQISPFFIVISALLFKPLEYVQTQRIVNRAKQKRASLTNLQTIAIVGSYAKTSTKNMLYTLLWKDFQVVKTPKSYNTELSIARSILNDLKEQTEIYICEMDAYHSGEIAQLCSIAQPNLGIITAIGPQHLERFGDMETLAKAQFELKEYLEEQSNRHSRAGENLFLNDQDEWSRKLGASSDLVIWYGDGKIYINNRKEYDHHQTFSIHLTSRTDSRLRENDVISKKEQQIEIILPLKGEHNAVNFLAAATIAHSLGISLKTIQQRASLILATDHRLEIRTTGNITLLDNSYNANPKAALASLALLASFKDAQKIVITPGFVELGKEHFSAHQEFGKEIAKVADEVIIVGEHAKNPLSKGLSEAKFSSERIHYVETTNEALKHLSQITKGDKVTVLLENDLPDQYF